MNRETVKEQLLIAMSDFPQAEIYYTGHNVVASFLTDKGAYETILAYGDSNGLPTREFGNANIIIECAPATRAPAKSEKHFLLFDDPDKPKNEIGEAIAALENLKDNPYTFTAQSAIRHAVHRLRNSLKRIIDKPTKVTT